MTPRFTRIALGLLIMALFPFLSSAEPLKAGDAAPLVTGTTDEGATLSLADLYQKNTYTLVYFYPKADTSGCTSQGCSLRDAYEVLKGKGLAVVGVSTDKVDAQHAFRTKYKFPFPLIADTEQVFVKAFGVPATLGFAKRQAFLMRGGRVVWADHSASTAKQAEDVLKAIESDKH